MDAWCSTKRAWTLNMHHTRNIVTGMTNIMVINVPNDVCDFDGIVMFTRVIKHDTSFLKHVCTECLVVRVLFIRSTDVVTRYT